MANYVIRQNGEIVAYGNATQDNFNAGYPEGFSWEDYTPPAVPVTVLSKLGYMNRFTDAELAAIYTAAKSVVQVEVWLEKFKLAEFIDLTDQRTIDGLNSLEAAGLLAAGRAAEILA